MILYSDKLPNQGIVKDFLLQYRKYVEKIERQACIFFTDFKKHASMTFRVIEEGYANVS